MINIDSFQFKRGPISGEGGGGAYKQKFQYAGYPRFFLHFCIVLSSEHWASYSNVL